MDKLILEYSGHDFNRYYECVLNDFRNVKKTYPLLELTLLPTRVPCEAYITGKLIGKDVLELCRTENQIEKFSMEILAVYAEGFPKNQLKVIDQGDKIKWSELPAEHMHINSWRNVEVLCTHHPNGEINGIKSELRTTAILTTSWNLYTAFNHYIRKSEWKLKELEHGDAAIPQLKREKKYYS